MSDKKVAIVVEDDEDILYVVEAVLSSQGYEIISASDGDKAFALLESGEVPDLFVTDVDLPFRDGISLVKHLRAKPPWQDVPVLVLTAKAQARDIDKAIDAGASDYLTKPFQPMDLIMRVLRITPQ